MQWQYKSLRTPCEVILEEIEGTWPAPLILEYQVVKIVVYINEKAAGKATGCGFNRTC